MMSSVTEEVWDACKTIAGFALEACKDNCKGGAPCL